MDRKKALYTMKMIKAICETNGKDIPQYELDELDSIISKLENSAKFEDFTSDEFGYLQKTYKSVYE